MKWRDLIRLIEKDGWYWVRTTGSHRVYRHPVKQNTVVMSPHSLGDDVPIGTEKSIFEECGCATMSDYIVVFERAADGTFSAYTPHYPIAISAPDRYAAKEKIVEAIQIYKEEMDSAGFSIPEPSVEYETVTV
jgi:predicted RNA binding protein YcfA (HicA-like mRNA interferase family)/predicted RNase H-like HicB family nuclease